MDQKPGGYGGSGKVRESRKLYNKLKKPPERAAFCKKIICENRSLTFLIHIL